MDKFRIALTDVSNIARMKGIKGGNQDGLQKWKGHSSG